MNNFFAALPAGSPDEVISVLLEKPGLRIERIASFGHASPDGFWYDQAQDEWLLSSCAAPPPCTGPTDAANELAPGDFRLIPAHCRHRVERTDPDTLWLALHFG